MDSYAYLAAAQLNDGSEVVLDLEQKGWADPALLARVTRFNLVPKDGALTMNGRPYPLVVTNIPEGGKPVFKTRVFGVVGVVGGEGTPLFRCYAVGYKIGRRTHLTWVLPTGDIEQGDDPWLADVLLRHLKGVDA